MWVLVKVMMNKKLAIKALFTTFGIALVGLTAISLAAGVFLSLCMLLNIDPAIGFLIYVGLGLLMFVALLEYKRLVKEKD